MVIRKPSRAAKSPEASTRDRITQAALAEFSRLGFDGASTRQIATRAGVNQGLLTYYFGDKEQLWKAAVVEAFTRLNDGISKQREALAEVDPITRLRLSIRHFIRFSAANPELHRLMIQEGGNTGPRTRWLLTQFVEPLFHGIRKLVVKARDAGAALPAIPPQHFFTMLLGAGPHPFATASETRHLYKLDPFASDAVEAWATSIETVLLGPPPAKAVS